MDKRPIKPAIKPSATGASGDESEDSSDSDSDDQMSSRPVAKPATAKQYNQSSDSSDSDSSVEKGKKTSTIKPVAKATTKKSRASVSSSDSCDEKQHGAKNASLSKKKKKKKESSESGSDTSDSSDESGVPNGNKESDDTDEDMEEAETSAASNKKRHRETEGEKPRKKLQLENKGGRNQSGGNSTEVFCGGLPFGTTEDDIRKLFEADCGKIVRVKLLGQGGAAFIQFENEDNAASALEWNNSDFKGRKLTINKASDRPQRKNVPQVENGTVCVRNLSFKASEDEIKDVFSECGEVSGIRIPIFPDSGKMRGYVDL